jgi:hypothetical protein
MPRKAAGLTAVKVRTAPPGRYIERIVIRTNWNNAVSARTDILPRPSS